MSSSTGFNERPPNPSIDRKPWGLAEASVGWLGFNIVGAFVILAVVAVGDWTLQTPARPGGNVGRAVAQYHSGSELTDDALPLLAQLLSLAPGWIALLGGAWLLAAVRGHSRPGWRVSFAPVDVPLGVATGLLLQVPVIVVLYTVLQAIFGDFALSNRAQTLADQVDTPLKVIAVFAFVAVGAPIVEELFYRGLVQRALVDRFGAVAGIAVSGITFGAVHLSLVEFPALVAAGIAFGVLYHRTGRLATPIIAHIAFNSFTLIVLLLL